MTGAPMTTIRIASLALFAVLAVAAAGAAAEPPLALRVDTEVLGRGAGGTVVGVLVQLAPEEIERVGERVRVVVSALQEQRLVDRQTSVVELQPDGSLLLYRELPPGTYELRVGVATMDGSVSGAWIGDLEVPEAAERFQAPEGATPDAVALELTPAREGAVRFLPPPDLGGIGALMLEVEVPEGTASVEFSQDGQVLIRKNRAPWTVSVPLGQIMQRTRIRAVAMDARGRYLGEDALALNTPTGEIGLELLLAPDSAVRDGRRPVTVSVTSGAEIQQVALSVDDVTVARWADCPCVVELPVEQLANATIIVAEAVDVKGNRGDAILTPGIGGGFVGSVRVELVELPIVVLDRSGAPVLGLGVDDFTVLEDRQEVEVEGFGTTADLPLSLAIAVDTSGSMTESFPQVRRALEGFVESLMGEGDEAVLLRFAWDATVEVPWTDQSATLGSRLERVVPEGGTSLHDAVVKALEQFRGRRGRQALVLLTDGEDTTSRTGWQVALRFAHTMRIPIFPIGLGVGGLDFSARGALRDLAQETGGEAFFPKKAEELPQVYARIAELLRSQYLLWYSSPSTRPETEFRAIEVRIARPEATVRTIRGYYPGR